MNGSEKDSFTQQIQAAQERFQQLKQRSLKFPWSQNEMAAEALEELSIALEELHVAAEEMYVQHQYLMTSQESLAVERQRYLDLFEFAPNGYVVTDVAGHIQEANWAAVELLGMPRDRLIGKFIVSFIPVAERKTFRTLLNQIQRTQTSAQSWEGQIQQKDKLIPCEISVSQICEAPTALVGLRWSIRDTSEHKRIVEMETASRVKDEFLAVVSHELRSPLNPILGWSRLLRSQQFDEPTMIKALDAIERNATHQARLIEDLLDVSRILRSKLSLNRAQVDLESVIVAALETVNLAAEAKGIKLYTNCSSTHSSLYDEEDSPIYVLGDSTRLQQVVSNLLSNAVKFTPAGGQIEAKLEQVGQEGMAKLQQPAAEEQNSEIAETNLETSLEAANVATCSAFAQITVTDTGKGIDPEALPFIFDYFRQADSSITRKFGGLGLGLAIVRHLVEAHGGTVQAESRGEGQGATFTVRLPLLATRSAAAQQNAAMISQGGLAGLEVLLVDDEGDTLDLLVFILEQQGANVTSATSASEALEKLTQIDPDIFISDISMPDIDGYALLQKIQVMRTEQGRPMPPAMCLTAYATSSDEKQALAAGFELHLSKPVDPNRLVKAIVDITRR